MNLKNLAFFSQLLAFTLGCQTAFASAQPGTLQLPSSFHYAMEKIKERNPELIAQIGGFFASYGKSQLIEIQGSNGNLYTKNGGVKGNVVPGLGFYVDGWSRENYVVKFGLDWLFLAPTTVSGNIQQEQLFSNLTYKYKIQNAPLFVASKVNFHNSNNNLYSWIFDAGIGPNFMKVSQYREFPLTT